MLPSISGSAVLAAGLLFLNGASATLDPIIIKGNKFFFKTNGTQFYIKGVAYQAGVSTNGASSTTATYTDPLADETTCTRDIKFLQEAGANVIRTYALDPTADHDACMAALDAAGIYLISDLSEPSTSINQVSPSWDLELYSRYTSVVDAMQKYDNVIGFFAGNEVTNNVSNTAASAFVKAAVRDTKAYISAKGYRAMGVGYAADDDPSIRSNVADYLNCGDSSTSIDFWGYNIYEWCGNSNYILSGYNLRTEEFANYSVPVFFAEYGCNTVAGGAGRTFTEIESLYGVNMTGVFSGGIVFEYFEDTNDYGLVTIGSNSQVTTMSDFNAWKTQIAAISVPTLTASAFTPTNTVAQTCPPVASTWEVNPTGLPPTPDADVCNCMMSSLSCTVASGLSDEKIESLFGEVCGFDDGKPCADIQKNTTTGAYGAFSMCNSTQMLANAFNKYYSLSNSDSSACDFDGAATVVKANAASTCSSVIASATANAAAGNTAANGGSPAASSSTKKSEGTSAVGATLGMGYYAFAGYTALALVSAVGMIML